MSSLRLLDMLSAHHSAKVCKATKKPGSAAQMYLFLRVWGPHLYVPL